jgi:hypothetical protein
VNPNPPVTAIFESWEQFTTGYEAGITDGIEIGRAQVMAEEWPIWQQFTRHVRTLASTAGPLEHTGRQAWIRARQERACQHPGWTPEQIREHAAHTWALPTDQRTATTGGRWSV